MYPFSIEIYKGMIKYFFYPIELAEKGNQIISCGMNECLTLVNKEEKCWLTSVLYIFNLMGINPDMKQLHLISNSNVLSSVVDKLQKVFKEKFFNEIANSSKLILYNHVKEEFREEKYMHEVKYYKYRSAITKFRISAHSFLVENGRWDKTPCEKCMCPLCFLNDIGNEKHCIFHCTNAKLVEYKNIHY